LLLDDELPGLTYLKMLCEQLPELQVVRAFSDPLVFLRESQSLDFDLCILDVEMPGVNGLQVTDLLKGKPIIFATAYKEYAAEAFDLDAIDYILKPIRLERLRQAVAKALVHAAKGPVSAARPSVQLNTDRGRTILFFDTIQYICVSDVDSRDKVAYLLDGEQWMLKNISFEKLLEILPSAIFCRINKSEIISLKIVQAFSYNEITTSMRLPSGKVLKFLLSNTYRSDFLEKIHV